MDAQPIMQQREDSLSRENIARSGSHSSQLLPFQLQYIGDVTNSAATDEDTNNEAMNEV